MIISYQQDVQGKSFQSFEMCAIFGCPPKQLGGNSIAIFTIDTLTRNHIFPKQFMCVQFPINKPILNVFLIF